MQSADRVGKPWIVLPEIEALYSRKVLFREECYVRLIQVERFFRQSIHHFRRPVCVAVLAATWSLACDAVEPPAAPAQAPAPQVNAVAQAAINAGALSCAARINQVSQFIGGNSKVGAFFFAPPAQPDQRLLSYSFEIQPPKGQAIYASSSFAPNQANGCGATYEAITYWPDKCELVAKKQFSELKREGQLQKEITVLVVANSARIFLMPAGNGCVSIKKEVVL